jgi:hypothetical protein
MPQFAGSPFGVSKQTRNFGMVVGGEIGLKGDVVTTIQEARPRVQRMLNEGYRLEEIDAKVKAIDGLDPERKSALWVWAWTFEDMGRQQAVGPPDARVPPRPPLG